MASTIATSIVHYKLDYHNSLYYNLPNTQLNPLQHIQNSLARAVVRPPSLPISTLLSNLYTLAIKFFLAYKVVTTTQLSFHIILSLFSPIVALVLQIS